MGYVSSVEDKSRQAGSFFSILQGYLCSNNQDVEIVGLKLFYIAQTDEPKSIQDMSVHAWCHLENGSEKTLSNHSSETMFFCASLHHLGQSKCVWHSLIITLFLQRLKCLSDKSIIHLQPLYQQSHYVKCKTVNRLPFDLTVTPFFPQFCWL